MELTEIELKVVNPQDLQFLYNLLKKRNSNTNISHKKMPTFIKHKKFVESKPYKKWYIVQLKNQKVGSIYLTSQNEIGIFIKKKFQQNNFGQKALSLLINKNPRKRYLANINPKNKNQLNFLKIMDLKFFNIHMS